jgi:hypothetical protein
VTLRGIVTISNDLMYLKCSNISVRIEYELGLWTLGESFLQVHSKLPFNISSAV